MREQIIQWYTPVKSPLDGEEVLIKYKDSVQITTFNDSTGKYYTSEWSFDSNEITEWARIYEIK